MKLYVVTADTYRESWGADIELLRVTDNEDDARDSVKYAKSKKWYPNVETIELNKPTRRYLGGYCE
jgi:hypothetical protein